MFGWLIQKRGSGPRKQLLTSRGTMNIDEWHAQYFSTFPRKVTTEVLGLLATCLKCDMTSFRPGDSFDRELKYFGKSILGLYADTELEDFVEYKYIDYLKGNGVEESTITGKIETIEGLMISCENMLKGSKKIPSRE